MSVNSAERHGIEKGLQQGFQKGRQENQRETALRMIAQTEMNDALIAELSGLPESEMVEQRRKLEH